MLLKFSYKLGSSVRFKKGATKRWEKNVDLNTQQTMVNSDSFIISSVFFMFGFAFLIVVNVCYVSGGMLIVVS